MSVMTKIVVTGASGRMGQMLIDTINQSDRAVLCGALERPGHPWVGRDIGTAMGGAATGVVVSDDPDKTFAKAQAVIDFTSPAASVAFATLAAQRGLVHVIGTTGLSNDDIDKINTTAQKTIIVRAGNMSLGVNLLVQLTKKVAAALDDDYDIEIVEAHHNQKVDAPSGTALMLGQAAADGRGVNLADASDSGRDGITGARTRGDIGFAALRGGSVAGDHQVIFATEGERIEIGHRAENRTIFARGAIRGATWLAAQPAGRYDMKAVLGL